jgi:glycosyltransferase involved in cell wall biosynthesis
MTNAPKVSLGMPLYNGANYLRKALDSLLAQSFTDFELVINDNASTDSSESLCREYADRDSRVKYHRNEKNVGAAPNYHLALTHACGKYFKWVAHDDEYHPDWLAQCVHLLDTHPEAILTYTRTILIDAESKETGRFNDPFRLHSAQPSDRFKLITTKLQWCHSIFGLMRRDVLIRLNPIGNYISSDEVFLAELSLYGQFIEDEHYWFYRRLHATSSSQGNKTQANLQAWYDPQTRGRLYLRNWRFLKEHSGSIWRSPMAFTEKVKCWVFLFRMAVWKRQDLVRESKLAAGHLLRKYLPTKTSAQAEIT